MNKYNQLGTLKYNQLGKVKYNSQAQTSGGLRTLKSRLGPRPIVLDGSLDPVAILEHSYDVFLNQEIKAMDELDFCLPFSDNKRSFLENEVLVQMFNTVYTIRTITDKKAANETDVHAEARWYDLQYTEPLFKTSWTSVTADIMMRDILSGTGWTVGVNETTKTRTLALSTTESSALNALRQVEDLYAGELDFDTVNMVVNLRVQLGSDSGAAIMYGKNMKDITALYDTRDMITKLYLYGKNNMTIADANNGITYLEDYSYYDNLGRTRVAKVRTTSDERYTNPFNLLDAGNVALSTLAKPQASYTILLSDLSDRANMSHEKFWIGDTVRVYDKEMQLDFYPRILKWKYDCITPENTEVTLQTVIKTLSDLLTGVDNFSSFTSADAVQAGDMLEMSVFNLLMNSRADDEYSYWTNDGWDIDSTVGDSGNSSFKADGASGVTKTLTQKVYPSNRDNYSISFKASADNVVKGPNGKVGVNVIITYDDGTTTTEFIQLA